MGGKKLFLFTCFFFVGSIIFALYPVNWRRFVAMVLKSEHTHTHREQWEKGDTHTEMHTRRADARSTGGAKSGGAPTTTIWMTGWTLGVVREPEAKEGLGGVWRKSER